MMLYYMFYFQQGHNSRRSEGKEMEELSLPPPRPGAVPGGMTQLEDAIAYLAQNIVYIVTIITTGVLSAKHIVAEMRKHAERIDKKIMGPDQNAKPGKGGAIDDLRQEFDIKLDNTVKDFDNKMGQSQTKLIYEYKRTTQKIDFVVSNLSRMERSLEKVTAGRYTAARLETNKEDEYNKKNNSDPNGDVD